MAATSISSSLSSRPSTMLTEQKNSNRTKSQNSLASDSNNSVTALLDERSIKKVQSIFPKKRHEFLKWDGWGYKDAGFYPIENKVIGFKGEQYPLHGVTLPYLTEWVKRVFCVNVHDMMPEATLPQEYPKPENNMPFLDELKQSTISYSQDGIDRLVHCHGQTLHDIYNVRNNKFKRIPDIVTWPVSHDEVKCLVKMAHKHNVVLIPYGGGTSVSGSITCPQNERRMICVADMTQMNRLLWLNKENLTACFEAGIVGQDLERVLQEDGLTLGHEPDSIEFSTLGGWVATRASGMKKNIYGNIEDVIINVKLVTAQGDVLQRIGNVPRISCGPDFNHIILGSEGTLGIITEVVVKLQPLPKVKRYGSLVFPDFECGVRCLYEISRQHCRPASIRLMDNVQFVMGQHLKPIKTWSAQFMDALKKTYLTTIKRFDLTKICGATILFEGDEKEVAEQEATIYKIAKKFHGVSGGPEPGERGYIMTFIIAYVRDISLSFGIIGESFETSVPWDRCLPLCHKVTARIEKECAIHCVKYFIVSYRVTQIYDVGVCVYFYFSFRYIDFTNPIEILDTIESAARDEILLCGGSISHHHGIGKHRSQWYANVITDTGVELYKAAKRQLDPKNIFAVGNLLPEEHDDNEGNCPEQMTHNSYYQAKL